MNTLLGLKIIAKYVVREIMCQTSEYVYPHLRISNDAGRKAQVLLSSQQRP